MSFSLLAALAFTQATFVRHGGVSSGAQANSVAAVIATANNNSVCTGIVPFYWEIGNSGGSIASQSVGTSNGTNSQIPSGQQITQTTNVVLASASKWIYATYVVQARGGIGSLTSGTTGDIGFLTFTSGYDQMGSNGSSCAGSTTVNGCLALNALYTTQNPSSIDLFSYDSGHMENHAGQNFPTLAAQSSGLIASTMWATFGIGSPMVWTSPLLSGGSYGNAAEYTNVLRNILSGTLLIGANLSLSAVCTNPGGDYTGQTARNVNGTTHLCTAVGSPFPENFQYSLGHWIETDPATHGDGAFSSAGSYGTYPWIEAALGYYGILVRYQTPATVTNGVFIGQQGYASLKCGRLLRKAWDTGIQQAGSIP